MKKLFITLFCVLFTYIMLGITKQWWPVDWWTVQIENQDRECMVTVSLGNEVKWTGAASAPPPAAIKKITINTKETQAEPAQILFADLTWPPGYVKIQIGDLILDLRQNGVTASRSISH